MSIIPASIFFQPEFFDSVDSSIDNPISFLIMVKPCLLVPLIFSVYSGVVRCSVIHFSKISHFPCHSCQPREIVCIFAATPPQSPSSILVEFLELIFYLATGAGASRRNRSNPITSLSRTTALASESVKAFARIRRSAWRRFSLLRRPLGYGDPA